MKAKTSKKELSEKISEKKKRGRPRFWNPEYEKKVRQERLNCDIRTLQNEDYEAHAINVLGIGFDNTPDFPYLWLADYSKLNLGKSQRRYYKKTILSELGRIKRKSNLIEAATEICHRKPKTQDAIKMIRGWRMKRPLTNISLKSTLQKAIEDYRKAHLELTENEIYETLSFLEEEYLQKIVFGE